MINTPSTFLSPSWLFLSLSLSLFLSLTAKHSFISIFLLSFHFSLFPLLFPHPLESKMEAEVRRVCQAESRTPFKFHLNSCDRSSAVKWWHSWALRVEMCVITLSYVQEWKPWDTTQNGTCVPQNGSGACSANDGISFVESVALVAENESRLVTGEHVFFPFVSQYCKRGPHPEHAVSQSSFAQFNPPTPPNNSKAGKHHRFDAKHTTTHTPDNNWGLIQLRSSIYILSTNSRLKSVSWDQPANPARCEMIISLDRKRVV